MTDRRSKSNIVADVIAAMPALTHNACSKAVDETLKAIQRHAHEGDMLVLTRFGTFTKRYRKESQTRNPRTGEPMTIPARTIITFKESKTDGLR